MRFEGKVIIVTGASSGIGRATAKQFAMEGGKVVAAARRFERLEALRDEVAAAGAPGCILPVKTDVRDPAQIDAMFDTCLAEFGHLDVLVNNAGMLDGQLPIHETSPEIYDMIYETNQRAVYLGCQRAIKIFLEQGTPANIVNVASAASLRGLKGGTMYVICAPVRRRPSGKRWAAAACGNRTARPASSVSACRRTRSRRSLPRPARSTSIPSRAAGMRS